MSAALSYIKLVSGDLTENSLRIKIVPVVGTPYVDCSNKDESLESLIRRAIVLDGEGNYALQVNYV
jgi:hypothetical protein